MQNRITDPRLVSGRHIDKILAKGGRPTIQFSMPGYSPRVLKSVNRLCRKFGDRLEVRFYGHYSAAFDAAVLAMLPDVQWLSIDCLLRVENIENVYALGNLHKLSFGVYEFDNPDFLSGLNLGSMKSMTLSENRKRNIDLRFLDQCRDLEELLINGHTRNVSAIAGAPKLSRLSLGSMPKKQSLKFVNDLPGLESLTIILGGRENIDELRHGDLHELEVLRVRGLNSLGSLARFPRLRRLRVEDQIQLAGMSFEGSAVQEIIIYNCKNLESLQGLSELGNLTDLRVSRTDLDLDRLLDREWPESLVVLALYSGSQKWNKRAREILAQRGYAESRARNQA